MDNPLAVNLYIPNTAKKKNHTHNVFGRNLGSILLFYKSCVQLILPQHAYTYGVWKKVSRSGSLSVELTLDFIENSILSRTWVFTQLLSEIMSICKIECLIGVYLSVLYFLIRFSKLETSFVWSSCFCLRVQCEGILLSCL